MRFLEADAHDDHHEEGHCDNETDKHLLTIKFIVLVCMFVAGAFVFFPYASFVKEDETLPDEQRKKKSCCKGIFFSMMNCFAAGMLLSMAICHILPEADAMFGKALAASAALEAETTEVTPEYEEEDHDHDGDGEEDHAEEDHSDEEGYHSDGEEDDHDVEDHEEEEHDDHGEVEHINFAEEGHDDHSGHAGEAEHGFPFAHTVFFGGFMMMLLFDKVIFGKAVIKVADKNITREGIKEAEMQIQNASDTEQEGGATQSGQKLANVQILAHKVQAKGGITGVKPSEKKMVNSDQNVSSPVKELQRISTQSLVGFGLAICSHSLIDGLAIGIFSDIGTITVLAVCVIIHKIPVACTVGTTFKSQSQELMAPSTIVVFVAFILATPIGMTIGMSIQESDETLLVFPIIQALSGGTFVYIACCDLLIHEFRHNTGQSKLLAAMKMGMMSFGAAIVITLIGVAPTHDH